MNTEKQSRDRDHLWAEICLAAGWICKRCGAVPERGKRFYSDLCEECRLRLNERIQQEKDPAKLARLVDELLLLTDLKPTDDPGTA